MPDFVSLPMTILEARGSLHNSLKKIYDDGEARAISDLVIEHLTGLRPTDRAFQLDRPLDNSQAGKLDGIVKRLLQQEPVQYVLNESWFCGLKFYVDNNVLIPRPETEELVEWVISDCKFPMEQLSILDIGCGSGCIPIALKRKLKKPLPQGLDASPAALEVAKRNASALGVEVDFLLVDFLDEENWTRLGVYDVITSNPPYIPAGERRGMSANVVDHEPSMALFVPDADPLVFYRAIARFGKNHLQVKGRMYMEMHHDAAEQVSALFMNEGYAVEVKEDMQQKRRMLKAWHAGTA